MLVRLTLPRPALPRLGTVVLSLALGVLTLPGAGPASAAAPEPDVAGMQAASSYLCQGYATCAAAGYSNAGYQQVASTKFWLMYGGHNCTNYVAYRMVANGMKNVRPWTGTGNAYNWGPANASKTSATPAVGAVAWWKAGVKGAGSTGHVAYVEQVVSADELIVSEDNWGGNFDWRRVKRSSGWPSGFIRFTPAPPGTGSPVGHTDSATSPAAHQLSLTGWAFDPDKITSSVYLRAYVGGSSGARQRLDLGPADLNRADLAKTHPGVGTRHGFSTTSRVTKSGKQMVWLYGLNKTGTAGKATLLYHAEVTITS